MISVAAAATLSQEVYAKEPPPPEVVPKEVVLYQYEACPFCNKVKGFCYFSLSLVVVVELSENEFFFAFQFTMIILQCLCLISYGELWSRIKI